MLVIKTFQKLHCYSANKLPVTTQRKCYREIFINNQGLSETRTQSNFQDVSYVFMIIVGLIAKRLLLTIVTRREIWPMYTRMYFHTIIPT
jgi:hypothetical protein